MSVLGPEVRRRPGAMHDELVEASLDAVYDPRHVAACRRIGSRAGEYGPSLVSGPFDLWYLRHLRERIGLPSAHGDVRATDVFVWSLDEAPHAAATRFGGMPYLPLGRPWPRRHGVDGRFLAQLDFADSRDLVPFAPADVLLVFTFDHAEASSWERDDYEFVWVDVDDAARHHGPERVPPNGLDPAVALHGVRVRSFDEPSLVARIRAEGLPHVHCIQGTKIGGAATNRQGLEPPETPADWRFLGQIAAQWPTNDAPFPVLGHPQPVTYGEQAFYDLMRGPGDGVLCLYLDAAGDVQMHFSCA